MTPRQIVERVCSAFDGVVPKLSWGETSLFYNPRKVLPNGVYFCTIKEKDGENDKASNLNRAGVFRMSIGLKPAAYTRLFGVKPNRPGKAGLIATGHDFTAINQLMPHPIYGWMCWAQILNPDKEKFEEILPLIAEAHEIAVVKFTKKKFTKKTTNNSINGKIE